MLLRSLVNTNPILSESGIAKAVALKNNLLALQRKNLSEEPINQPNASQAYERSDYSKLMVSKVIETIDYVLKYNQINYWGFIANKMKNLFNVLDYQRNTKMPEVFNQESYELIRLINAAFKEGDLKCDLTEDALTLRKEQLSSDQNQDLNNSLNNAINWLEQKLKQYFYILNQDTFTSHTEHFLKKMDQLLHDINTDSCLDFTNQKSDCIKLLEEIKQLPYQGLKVDKSLYINAKLPYLLNPSFVTYIEYRRTCLPKLLNVERCMNRRLLEAKLPLFKNVYSYIHECFSFEMHGQLNTSVCELITSLNSQLYAYQKNDENNFVKRLFSPTDANKMNLSINALNEIAGISKDNTQTPTYMAFNAFTIVMRAAIDNDKLPTNVGNLSRLTNLFAFDLLNLCFSTNETNDITLLHELNNYEIEFDLPLTQKKVSTCVSQFTLN